MANTIEKIIEVLDDKKALNIETFDLSNKDYIANEVIIATSLNNKHTVALLSILKDELANINEEVLRTQEDNDWSVIDLGNTIIHIMTQEQRDLYNLADFLADFQK